MRYDTVDCRNEDGDRKIFVGMGMRLWGQGGIGKNPCEWGPANDGKINGDRDDLHYCIAV